MNILAKVAAKNRPTLPTQVRKLLKLGAAKGLVRVDIGRDGIAHLRPAVDALDLQGMLADPLRSHDPRKSKSGYELMKDGFECFDIGIQDLATNPKYVPGFGKSRKSRS